MSFLRRKRHKGPRGPTAAIPSRDGTEHWEGSGGGRDGEGATFGSAGAATESRPA